MKAYRMHLLDQAGQNIASQEYLCAGDHDALSVAIRLAASCHSVKVFDTERFVMAVPHQASDALPPLSAEASALGTLSPTWQR